MQVCPKGIEALVYALLAGFQNFGGTVGSYAGVYFTSLTTIQTDPKKLPWNFDDLPMLLFIGHIVLPLIQIPLTFVLIPDVKMDDSLEEYVQDLEAPEDLDQATLAGSKVVPVEPLQ